MAYVLHAKVLAGEPAVYTGEHRCTVCSWRYQAVAGEPLPGLKHHPHREDQPPIQWEYTGPLPLD